MKAIKKKIYTGAVIIILLSLSHSVLSEKINMDDPVPPTAIFDWDPEYPHCFQDIVFDGTLSKRGSNPIESYSWSIGGSGETITYSWPVAGEYSVTLIVTDTEGLSDSYTDTVNVGTGDVGTSGMVQLEGEVGQTVSDTFIVKNICAWPGSELNWEIKAVSKFTFEPSSGTGLKYQEEIKVTVTHTLEKGEDDYDDPFIVKNTDKFDISEVPVTISLKKCKPKITVLIEHILERYCSEFPLLNLIFSLTNIY